MVFLAVVLSPPFHLRFSVIFFVFFLPPFSPLSLSPSVSLSHFLFSPPSLSLSLWWLQLLRACPSRLARPNVRLVSTATPSPVTTDSASSLRYALDPASLSRSPTPPSLSHSDSRRLGLSYFLLFQCLPLSPQRGPGGLDKKNNET